MTELKACPFCGGEAYEYQREVYAEGYETVDEVECGTCGARCDTPKEWNTRKSEWVSVDEMLPEKSGDYLCRVEFEDEFLDGHLLHKGGVYFNVINLNVDGVGVEFTSGGFDEPLESITHWQSITKPGEVEHE